ncbi:MAG TPA: alpha/beta hydrolase [Rhizomicrobium sp.]|nr:alpha/beta hydrolase [Rhizomicrobium sp.]
MLLLYVEQRAIQYQPGNIPFGPPPPEYSVSHVAVPGSTPVLVWSIPPASDGEPTFVFFSGNAARIVDFVATGEAFHARGWGVVLASYRGFSGNPGTPTEDGLMADARAVLASLPRHGTLIVWGHSLGSGVAAQMAAEHRADGLVLESAYTSAADVGQRRYWMFPVRWLMRDPFDTEKLVPRIKVPVLLIHGTDDSTIPFDMSQTLAREFGRRAMLVPVPDVDHVPHRIDLSPVVARWLARAGLAGAR